MKAENEKSRRAIPIGMVINTAIKPHRDVLLGWMRVLRKRDDIDPRYFFAGSGTSVANLEEFAASGVEALMFCGVRKEIVCDFLRSPRCDMPVVLFASAPLNDAEMKLLGNGGVVMLDNESIGRYVGRFFLEHGLENFAFLTTNLQSQRVAGRVRCDAFRAEVMAAAGTEVTFCENFVGECRENEDFWDMPQSRFISWVKSLPLPCGVFVSGDRSSCVLLDACLRLGIDVPGKIEIVGVNNSRGLCEGVFPAISSIQPDYDECGWRMVQMAFELAGGGGTQPGDVERVVSVSAFRLVERGSSKSGRSHGKIVTRAKEFIRKNACDGISVVDVARHVGVSRRTLEVRVKYATGSSVLGLIRDVRLDNICRLLKSTDLSLTEVITRSGYNLTANVGVLFKKTYGLTMRQYREACRNDG